MYTANTLLNYFNTRQFSLSRIFLVKSVDGEPWQNVFSLTGLIVQNYHAGFWTKKLTNEYLTKKFIIGTGHVQTL